MTTRMDAPTVSSLVARLRSAAAAAGDGERAAALAFDELLRRASPSPPIHTALAQYWSSRTGAGTAICGHIGQLAEALRDAADELERDDAAVAQVLA